MTKLSEDSEVTLSLTKAEALVLFELLSRFSDTDKLSIEHEAENQALWNLCCLLESALVEPFCDNYEELLHDARESLLPHE